MPFDLFDAIAQERGLLQSPPPAFDLIAAIAQERRDAFPPTMVRTVFASGLQIGQLWGFAEAGYGIGVSLGTVRTTRLFRRVLAEVERIYQGMPLPWGGLLLDNGSVQEIDLGTGRTRVPIPPAEWDRRMELYLEAARRLPGAVSLITPDKIGDQAATLQRFARQAKRLRQMISLDATLVIALQPGELPLWDLDQRLRRQLRRAPQPKRAGGHRGRFSFQVPSIVPAVPMRLLRSGPRAGQTVTPLSELLEYVRRIRPSWLHLLGMGPRSLRLPDVLQALHTVSPTLRVSLDAALIRSVAGRAWSRGAKGQVQRQIERQWRPTQQDVPQVDLTEAAWSFEPDELAQIARRAGVASQTAAQIADAPTRQEAVWAFYRSGQTLPGGDPQLEAALLRTAWIATPKLTGVPQRDRRLVHRLFGDED